MSTRKSQFFMYFGRETNWYVATLFVLVLQLNVRLFGSIHASFSPLSVDQLGCSWCRSNVVLLPVYVHVLVAQTSLYFQWTTHLSIFVFTINGHRPSFSTEWFIWVTSEFDIYSQHNYMTSFSHTFFHMRENVARTFWRSSSFFFQFFFQITGKGQVTAWSSVWVPMVKALISTWNLVMQRSHDVCIIVN